MKPPPFKMLTESDMEKYRHDTFWTKEPETIEWIKSFAPGDIFYDVGANIGVYSLYCAETNPSAVVYAFEPDQKNYYRLLDNISLNGFFSTIMPYRYIISDCPGLMGFKSASDEIGASGGQAVSDPEGNRRAFSIDTLGMCYSPTHIKIDIDGQELRVVRGMTKTLADKRLQTVLIEIDRIEENCEIATIFHEHGFTTANRFNSMSPHSRERRAKEKINVENIVFTRS